MCLGLLEEDWNVAIILDACRYDTFKEVYRKYLPKGKLEKRVGATWTLEWLHKNFPKKHYPDIVYVSGHPGINSKNIAWGGFNATRKFFKVYDAWEKAWDRKIGTSDPYIISKIARSVTKKWKNRKRVIVHFMQPHTPYRKSPLANISTIHKVSKRIFLKNMERLFDEMVGTLNNNIISCFYSNLRNAIAKFRANFLKKRGIVEDFYLKKYTIDEIKKMYKDSLEWALKSVSSLISGDNFIITSDHGEAFGERNEFFHPPLTNNPSVRNVPFLRV